VGNSRKHDIKVQVMYASGDTDVDVDDDIESITSSIKEHFEEEGFDVGDIDSTASNMLEVTLHTRKPYETKSTKKEG
jgi:hypothetical protein